MPALVRHPMTLCDAVDSIEVEASPGGSGLVTLTYRLTGRIADLYVPRKQPSYRTDELWKTTCFEAFLRPDGSDRYVEFNFAPSTQWAAYRFEGYRDGMKPAGVSAPSVKVEATADSLTLMAICDPLLPPPWHVGLTAVIQERTGRISYWALAHPPGRPDFHHADGFVLPVGA